MSEPKITINGRELTESQAMTVRVAINNLALSLEDGLGQDEHGRRMTEGYRAGVNEVLALM